MRILILAPHPFYQERGTPIAVDLLLRALSERGDIVDVLTFHEGEDRDYEGVAIHRIQKPLFGLSGVRPGPSIKKLICDFYLLVSLMGRLRKEDYDIIHAVEESAFMAMVLKPFTAVPFIYDMDSSLATQLVEKYALMRPFGRLLHFIDSLPVRSAEAVVPMCDALANHVSRYSPRHISILKDVSLIDEHDEREIEEKGLISLRDTLGISGSISMYIGNLESYQGIGLLLESFAQVCEHMPDACLLVIGGIPSDIDFYSKLAVKYGIADNVHFLGRRPVSELNATMRQADVLVSPRTQGVNTPMKIYSYLHSGVPVLATDLPTHTQVMDSTIAQLAPAEASDFAHAWLELLDDPAHGADLAARAQAFISREHSYTAFRTAVHALYDHVEQRIAIPLTSNEKQ